MVQIIIGVLAVLFSLTAIFSPTLMLHAPLCLAVTVRTLYSPQSNRLLLSTCDITEYSPVSALLQFIVSGSMALVAAAKQTTVPLVSKRDRKPVTRVLVLVQV